MKQLAVPTLLGHIQSGKMVVEDLIEEDGVLTIRVKVPGAEKTETKAEAVEAAEATPDIKEIKSASKKGHAQMKEAIYNLLPTEKGLAVNSKYLRKFVPLQTQALNRYLRELEKEGRIQETSGFKTKNFRWIRKPLKVHVGG